MDSTPPRAEPRFFGPAARPLFGWLHLPGPSGPRLGLGLVICNPFGYEALCAHRSLCHFAHAAAETGVPAFRFDYDGTGDSAGDDRDPDRWPAWLASVHAAVDELKAEAGVDRVCLLGVRLGATLASVAASQRDDVSGLVAIVPVLAGKAWLREVRALQLAIGLGDPPPGVAREDDLQESAGFRITGATRDAVQDVNLLTLTRRPAPEVLLLDRSDLPANQRLAEHLATLGSRVQHLRLRGYVEMMLDPHESAVPGELIGATVAWLGERATAAGMRSREPAAPASRAARVAPDVEETPDFLDQTRTLFGIVSAPSGVQRPARAIVLLNAGAIHHIGPNRLHVQLARRWAARGYLVLRFDVSGIGDSPPWPGEPENVVYSPWAVRDLATALSALAEGWGVAAIDAAGMCSGAYHAFKGAVAGLPLRRVVPVNPLVYFWKPGMSLSLPEFKVSQAAAGYRRSIMRLDKWKKLFAGKVDVREFAHVALRRGATLATRTVRDIARAIGLPLTDDLGAELEALARRDLTLRFVFAAGDPGDDLLRVQAGSSLPRLLRRKRLGIQRIEGPDHIFTPVWSHAVLTSALEAALDIR